MTITLSIIGTLVGVFLLAGVHQAGVRKGTKDTLDELRKAVHLAGLRGAVTGQRPIHEGQFPSN